MPLKTEPLASLCEAVVDCPHSTPVWTDSGFVVLRNQNIKDGRLDLSAPSYTDEAHFKQRIRRMAPRAGDIVITREAPMGEVCKVPVGLTCCLGQRQVLLRPLAGVNSDYLLYALQSQFVREQILWNEGTGSTVSNIRIPVLEKIEIPRLGAFEDAVADALGSVDAKIDLNRRINQTLEAMAKAIFKSWFVDFDPVKAKIAAKAEGRDPLRAAICAVSGKTDVELDALPPEQHAQLAATAALFPDEIEDSELGEIPRGWTTGPISELAEITIGGDWGKDQADGDKYVEAICLRGVDLEHLRTAGNCPKAPVRWVKKSSVEKRELQATDVLIGGSGAGPCGRPLHVAETIKELVELPIIYSNFVKRLRCKSAAHATYLDTVLWGLFDGGGIQNYINGTSVPNLNDRGLLSHCILVPNADVVEAYAVVVRMWQGSLYSKQSTTLAAMRDELLPKLLSGELDVQNGEAEATA